MNSDAYFSMDDLNNIMLSEKKPITKDYTLYDSIYVKCPV